MTNEEREKLMEKCVNIYERDLSALIVFQMDEGVWKSYASHAEKYSEILARPIFTSLDIYPVIYVAENKTELENVSNVVLQVGFHTSCITLPMLSEDERTEFVLEFLSKANGTPRIPCHNKTRLHYRALKDKHPNAVLLFRTGDFYECYQEDASLVSELLGLTLTMRSAGDVTLCGFPYHALDTYLPKLIKAGHRIAINDTPINDGEKVKEIVELATTPE